MFPEEEKIAVYDLIWFKSLLLLWLLLVVVVVVEGGEVAVLSY